jgi:methanogenic corrinoid protein MtbC1
MTDHVRVAQEHLVSNIVRQKLIMGIENVSKILTSPRTAVLFLPEGEYHEIGLLYVHYLLKVRGLKIIYLGADVPVEELEYVCRVRKPDFLYTHMTSLPVKFSFEKFLSSMQKCSRDTSVLMSGKITHGYDKKIPAGIIFKKTLDEVITHLAGNTSN